MYVQFLCVFVLDVFFVQFFYLLLRLLVVYLYLFLFLWFLSSGLN